MYGWEQVACGYVKILLINLFLGCFVDCNYVLNFFCRMLRKKSFRGIILGAR